MLILGIESSCDETAIAIVKDGRKVISNQIFSQISKHQEWGGVIPELASRMHLEVINDLLKTSLEQAQLTMEDISAIAVTQGPGLLGSLLVGINFAKTLAWIYDKPLIPVNHLHGHICANFLNTDDLVPPFLCLLASGGHTQIIHVKDYDNYQILGETIDDAAGEAFDKVARLMKLAYPGGPEIDKLASTASDNLVSDHDPARFNSTAIKHGKYIFPVAKVGAIDFSFSGLKTSVLRLKEKIGEDIWERDKPKIARAFQESITKTFLKKIKDALTNLQNETTIVIAGGVAANTELRKQFKKEFSDANGYKLIIPDLQYCTDNAAMIASAGYFNKAKSSKDFGFEGFSRA
jgi:N6-L-threonylcarbamoyladenine synthase